MAESTAGAHEHEQAFKNEWNEILYKFALKSPPCQLHDVLDACRQLTQATLPAEFIGKTCTDYNEKNLLPMPLHGEADGAVGLCCLMGRDGVRRTGEKKASYVDPSRTELVFCIEQEKQSLLNVGIKEKCDVNVLTDELGAADLSMMAPFRDALQNKLNDYVAKTYQGRVGEGAAGASVYSNPPDGLSDCANDIELMFYISVWRSRPKGHWSGMWSSKWSVEFKLGEKPKLVGELQFSSHFAEDGNSSFTRKMSTRMVLPESIDEDESDEFAYAVMQVVSRIEHNFHQGTEDVCVDLNKGAFKTMRRVLPVTKERFDWRPIRHALVRDIKAADLRQASSAEGT